jgi:TorA maturation chaperone TorD
MLENKTNSLVSLNFPLSRAKLARFIAVFLADDSAIECILGNRAVRTEIARAAEFLDIAQALVDRVFDEQPAGEIEAGRNRLLGHTVRSACPPYELEYGATEVFQQSQMLADIAGFYEAFGYQAAGPLAERPDHIVCEWEFMSILAHKEAIACGKSDADGVSRCRDAQRAFLKDHAGRWMHAFFERVRREDPGGPWAHLADLGDAVLRSWCADADIANGPAWLELRPVSDDDSDISCGAPAGTGAVELGPVLAAAMEAQEAP